MEILLCLQSHDSCKCQSIRELLIHIDNILIKQLMRAILITLLLLCSSVAYADNVKRPDSYNLTRGVEAIENNNYEEALEYLNKEIAEHPDNGYAYVWIAAVRNQNGEFGRALTASNVAIKKIPAKDKEYKSFAYSTRAKVYLSLGDTVRAVNDYTQAISVSPDDDRFYEERAQVYYEQGKYDLADEDYCKMIALNEGDVSGYMGLGRNANALKKYVEAIMQFDYVIKLEPDYSSGYSFRAESYMGLKKYNEAIDDAIKALSINQDIKAYYLLQDLADSAFTQTVAKLKIQKMKEPKEKMWLFTLGTIYETAEKYKTAVSCFKEFLAQESNNVVAYHVAWCYDKMGDYTKALDYCNQAIALDSTDMDCMSLKASILDNAGKNDEAIKVLDDYIALNPESPGSYAGRGLLKYHSGDFEGALEDYTMGITLEPEGGDIYALRGLLYQMKGDTAAANEDFRQTVRLDSVPGESPYSFYAYYYLGNKDKATDVLKALEKGGKEDYNVACFYAIMGEKDKSISYLRKALEDGYRNFGQIKRDHDFDNIRSSAEYVSLIKEFEERHKAELAEETDESVYEHKSEEIPFTKEGGVCKVKCHINNLPLHFIFDTGAADVSMSSVEATFMLKNGYLSTADVLGKQNYMTADGNISEGTIINLRDVKLGSLHLKDIKASVVRNQSAPLLLGQSVLSKLGKIEIDNGNKVLRVTYKQKVK